MYLLCFAIGNCEHTICNDICHMQDMSTHDFVMILSYAENLHSSFCKRYLSYAGHLHSNGGSHGPHHHLHTGRKRSRQNQERRKHSTPPGEDHIAFTTANDMRTSFHGLAPRRRSGLRNSFLGMNE